VIRCGPTNAIHFGEMLGYDIAIRGCDIDITADHASGEGFIYGLLANTLTRAGGTFVFSGNVVNLRGYGETGGGAARLLYLRQTTTTVTDAGLVIEHNAVHSTRSQGVGDYAFWPRGDTGKTFRFIHIHDNLLNGIGIRIGEQSPEVLSVQGNTITSPAFEGIQTTANATPVYTTTATVRGNVVTKPWRNGISLVGTTNGVLTCAENTVRDANQSTTGTASTGSAIFLTGWTDVIYRDNTLGDTQGVTTQAGLDSVTSVTTLRELDNITIGTVTTRTRTSVTSRVFRGRGSGAPSFAAAVGSIYYRSDGGAVTTLYVNEAGTSTWVAK
jgi:hypothetical protein